MQLGSSAMSLRLWYGMVSWLIVNDIIKFPEMTEVKRKAARKKTFTDMKPADDVGSLSNPESNGSDSFKA